MSSMLNLFFPCFIQMHSAQNLLECVISEPFRMLGSALLDRRFNRRREEKPRAHGMSTGNPPPGAPGIVICIACLGRLGVYLLVTW